MGNRRWAAWVDALKVVVAVTAAWLPRRARALQVAMALGDEAGGAWGGSKRAQRNLRRTRPGFRCLLFLSPLNLVPWGMRAVRGAHNRCGVVPIGRERDGMGKDMEVAATCRWVCRVPSVVERSVSVGGGGSGRFWGNEYRAIVVVGEVAEAETERGESNDSLRDAKGCPLEKFGREPSKLILGALSCDSGLMVWRDGRGRRSCFSWEEMAHHR